MSATFDPDPEESEGSPVTTALGSGRRAILLALRRRLAGILDGTVGHERGCDCQCGAPWDTGKVAGISRELREVVRELDDLPNEAGGSEVASIQAQREKRRNEARAQQDQG